MDWPLPRPTGLKATPLAQASGTRCLAPRSTRTAGLLQPRTSFPRHPELHMCPRGLSLPGPHRHTLGRPGSLGQDSPKLGAGPHGAVGERSLALSHLLGQQAGQRRKVHA